MLAQVQTAARSLDTREKINLGGLVILAELSGEDSAVLLGLLAMGKAALAGPDGDAVRASYRQEGDRVFKATDARRVAARTKAEATNR